MIWVILLLGLSLRLISLDQSLWLDEAINVLAAKNYSFIDLITKYAVADFHPPGHFIILWFWGRIFGFSEITVRMPSVIFGILTIFTVYLIGKKLISKKLGLISALLLSVNPLHIYYSQEARMYSLAAFAATLNFFLFIRFLKEKQLNGIYLTLSNLLVLLSDYVTYLVFPAQLIFLFVCKQTKFLKKWFIFLFLSGVVGIAWIPIFLSQLLLGSSVSQTIPAWKEVVGSFGLKSLSLTYVKFIIGRISHPDILIYATLFVPVGLLFLFLLWRSIKFSENFVKQLLIVWLLVPIIFTSLISISLPIYSYFRLLFTLPSFLILIALGILSFRSKLKFLILFSLILVEVICSSIYLFNSTFQREDWRGLVNFLKSSKTKDSEVLFESNGSFSPFDYYAKNEVKGIGALKKFPAKDKDDLIDLQNILENNPDIYLVNYLVEISDPNRIVEKKLTQLNYKQVDIKNFNGVGFVYHFVK